MSWHDLLFSLTPSDNIRSLLDFYHKIIDSALKLKELVWAGYLLVAVIGGMFIRRQMQNKDICKWVPRPREVYGRDSKFDEIHKHFFPGGQDRKAARKAKPPSESRGVLLCAPGGFGKSSVAREYAHKYAAWGESYFKIVYWLKSDNIDSLLNGDKGIKGILGNEITTIKDAASSLRSHFERETDEPCLLIFDNVEPQTEEAVKEILQSLPFNVRVISTSRTDDWDAGRTTKAIRLDKLNTKDSVRLLRELSDRKKEGDEDGLTDGSRDLAVTLDGHPLQLALAADACKNSTHDFVTYREGFEKQLLMMAPPAGADYPYTLLGTTLQSLKIAGTLVNKGDEDDVKKLAYFLSYCSPDYIQGSLISSAIDDQERFKRAYGALLKLGLIVKVFSGDAGDAPVSMHRLVQKVLRHIAEDEAKKKGRNPGVEVIDRLVPFLYNQLSDDSEARRARRGKRPDFDKYFPHLLQFLPELSGPVFRGSKHSNLLDELAKLIVLALERQYRSEQESYPKGMPDLLGCFYEVDPLKAPLEFLLQRIAGNRRENDWVDFRDACLNKENYVLRFALAEALAAAVQDKKLGRFYERLVEVDGLVSDPKPTLNKFELGGYALKSILSEQEKFDQNDKHLLTCLAAHPCYPGRSILGDLFLNLVYQKHDVRQLLPEEGGNNRFWTPKWDFVSYDVNAIRAADYQNNNKTLPADASQEVKEEYEYLRLLKAWQNEARKLYKSGNPFVRLLRFLHLLGKPDHGVDGIVEIYLKIGVETETITAAEDDFASLANAGKLELLLRLLFGHPLWSVAESAASVVAGLVREAKTPGEAEVYIALIRQLLAPHLPWRVRYGAMETAFQIRLNEVPKPKTFFEGKAKTFFDGVKRFHNDPVSKLRGLCAENLFAIMLNASDADREKCEAEFDKEIRAWLKDEDCWVLEHIFRYFHELQARGAGMSLFKDAGLSVLMNGLDDPWGNRERFLTHIDGKKGSRAKTEAAEPSAGILA